VIAVALHDRLAVAAIRTSAIGLRMHVEQNVFHNGSSSMAASPNTDSKAIAALWKRLISQKSRASGF
jgi:hypothetical protein